MKKFLVAAACLIICGNAHGADAPAALFPFVLPWDDATPGVTNVSSWLHRPAGKLGHVHAGADGRLHAGNERIRFFGVNLCYAANFPRKEDADKIAARLAKFGVNAVRFHHLDQMPFPSGIRAQDPGPTARLDAEALDRLDFFIARLKEHGVYANLNLLVLRPFDRADGLPADIEKIDIKDRHVIGFFDERARTLQKDYARALLAHRNPHTRLTYAEDPAVAFVEVNNENGLIHGWRGGQVDSLPAVFRQVLERQWNDWLRKRHGSTDAVRGAWGARNDPPGKELLTNPGFQRGIDGWVLERHAPAEADAAPNDAVPAELKNAAPARSVRIDVTRADPVGWHVQFHQPALTVQAEKAYTLEFWAKADKPRTVQVVLGQAHEPWSSLGSERQLKFTPEWKSFRLVVVPRAADTNARLAFTDLASQAGTVWLAGLSFRPGGAVGLSEAERVESGTLKLIERGQFGERSAEAQRDWIRFLWETESAYWQDMQRFLKEDLRVKAVVIGTIVGCSTPNLTAQFDAVDTHAYWQHPEFSGRQWDAENWLVRNRSMVDEPGGTLPALALSRVRGKPHCVTEYGHPAPNTYAGEGLLLLAAYGALQDWDALFAFAYSHRDRWDVGHVPGFFDIDQHPAKMATLPAAVALFTRGDVRPAREEVVIPFGKDRELEHLRHSHAWQLVRTGELGVPPTTALLHRTALRLDDNTQPKPPAAPAKPAGATSFRSDTGELLWDLGKPGRGVVAVTTAKSKAVIGYGGGRRLELDGVAVESGSTLQAGWGTVTLTALRGDFKKGQLLVTATGLVENTGMRWKSPTHESVGRDWGTAPSRVEGIAVHITLPAAAKNVRLWALDEKGQRRQPVPVQADAAGRALLPLDPSWQTLWYEVEAR